MKRFTTFTTINGGTKEELKMPHSKWGKKCIDLSMYQPQSELVKQIEKRRNLTGDEVKGFYDFANGRDTGRKIPLSRQAKNNDLATLSQEIRKEQTNVNEKIANAENLVTEKAKMQTIINGSDGTTTTITSK